MMFWHGNFFIYSLLLLTPVCSTSVERARNNGCAQHKFCKPSQYTIARIKHAKSGQPIRIGDCVLSTFEKGMLWVPPERSNCLRKIEPCDNEDSSVIRHLQCVNGNSVYETQKENTHLNIAANQSSYYLTSPNFPLSYGTVDSHWTSLTLHTSLGHGFTVRMLDLDLPYQTDGICSQTQDHLYISEVDTPLRIIANEAGPFELNSTISIYCGNKYLYNKVIHFPCNTLFIKLIKGPDTTSTFNGFLLHVQTYKVRDEAERARCGVSGDKEHAMPATFYKRPPTENNFIDSLILNVFVTTTTLALILCIILIVYRCYSPRRNVNLRKEKSILSVDGVEFGELQASSIQTDCEPVLYKSEVEGPSYDSKVDALNMPQRQASAGAATEYRAYRNTGTGNCLLKDNSHEIHARHNRHQGVLGQEIIDHQNIAYEKIVQDNISQDSIGEQNICLDHMGPEIRSDKSRESTHLLLSNNESGGKKTVDFNNLKIPEDTSEILPPYVSRVQSYESMESTAFLKTKHGHETQRPGPVCGLCNVHNSLSSTKEMKLYSHDVNIKLTCN